MIILPISSNDTTWINQVLTNVGSPIEDTNALLGYIAKEGDRNVGLITFKENNSAVEIISLNSLIPGKGIGSALYEKVEQEVKTQGCKKMLTKLDDVTKDFFLKKGFGYSKSGLELEKNI